MFRSIMTLSVVALAATAVAGPYLPTEAGTTVNGYQDTFDSLDQHVWTAYNATAAVNTPGTLTLDGLGGDAHLFLDGLSYDDTVQEVLALVRPVAPWGPSGDDGIRGGVAVNGDTVSNQAHNLLLREKDTENARMLDDGRAWGPEDIGPDFATDTSYWLRLKTTGGELLAKSWLATETEPVDWVSWTRGGRTGVAGLTAGGSATAMSTLEVDYFLLKAEGLPEITVVPEPASLALLALVGLAVRRR